MAYLFETEEHVEVRKQARRFAERFILPHADAWEQACEFPRSLYEEASRAGVLQLGYPEADGGAGGDITHQLAAVEEVILAGKSVGAQVGIGSHAIALPPIVRFGTPEQRRRWVTPVLEGKKISALAVTEPGAGSDVAALSTKAERRGDKYIVNGGKTFITSGVRADFVTTLVRTGDKGHGGISMLVIEKGTPGFSVVRKLDKMGWSASDTAELAFVDCEVPIANLIGQEGGGFIALMQNFVAERILLAAQCLGIAELAHSEAIAYTKERKAFGKTLSAFQVTRHTLAEMATRIAAVRSMVTEIVQRFRREENVAPLAAMTKNVATDMCSFVCDHAVQLHGGNGYMRGVVVERLYRDARLYPIGGGTREIMNEVIAKFGGY
jgi:acyl-CoA dehydrogenase